jgi:hypothetical protein
VVSSGTLPFEDTPARSTANLDEFVRLLPPERREPVRRFVGEVLCACPYCGAEVRRNTRRGLDADGRLGCLACVSVVVGQCALCRAEVTRKHRREQLGGGAISHRECVEKRRR